MENKNNKCYSTVVIAVFAVIIGVLTILNVVIQPPHILISERRVRDARPNASFQSFVSGEFMDGFEGYAADRFPFRDGFRALRAAMVYGVFLQTDKDGVYIDSHGLGSFQASDAQSIKLLGDKIEAVSAGLSGLNIYYAFIPDKSIFADRTMPGFDYRLTELLLRNRLPSDEFTFIPLVSALSADSFYKTDLHWCQVSIDEVAVTLAGAMGVYIDFEQFAIKYAGQFRGGYAGQFALPVRSESLYYLFNPDIRAFYMNMGTRTFEEGPVYDLEMFYGIDPYDVFLRGIQPLVMLKNENSTSDRALYIFRDSFASSLAPILAGAYSRVTLVDLRFIDLRTLHTLIDFTDGADVLFLYSSGVLNNAEMLLVPLS